MASALLAAFAHPDDETFAVGGTLHRYADRGVTLVCATRGAAGRTSGVEVAGPADVARIREAELRAAAAILGIGRVVLLDHPDGGLAQVDPDVLVGSLVRAIRAERPRVVLSFGPEGAPTQHRDHRAISRATTAAFFLAAIPTALPDAGAAHRAARLCYLTWATPLASDELQAQGLPIDVAIDTRPSRDAKWRAFLAHRSQGHHEARFRTLSLERDEFFALGSGVPFPSRPADDLFAGLSP